MLPSSSLSYIENFPKNDGIDVAPRFIIPDDLAEKITKSSRTTANTF